MIHPPRPPPHRLPMQHFSPRVVINNIGDKPVDHECRWHGCYKRFKRKRDLLRHVRGHVDHRPELCKVCDRAFHDTRRLRLHMLSHTRSATHRCPEPGCDRVYKSISALRVHSRKHSGANPYACPGLGCDRTFAQSGNMRRHARSAHGILPCPCPVDGCSAAFDTFLELRHHASVTHKDPTLSS